MIVCDGLIFRADEVESVGSLIDEGGICWFAIRTTRGSEHVIWRQTMDELFDRQADLFFQLAKWGESQQEQN